jgi:hypothetical protein
MVGTINSVLVWIRKNENIHTKILCGSTKKAYIYGGNLLSYFSFIFVHPLQEREKTFI